MAHRPRHPSIRPSLVDAGWANVPSVVPDDTVVGGSTESNELTAPMRSSRDSQTDLSQPTGEIDELLETASERGFPRPPRAPSFSAPSAQPHPPPPPSHRPQPPSHRPQPPSHRPPPPSHRPPPPSHRPPPPPSHRLPPPSHRTLQLDYPQPPRQPDASSMAFAPTQPLPAHAQPGARGRVAPPRPELPSDMPMQELRSEEAPSPSSRLPAGIQIPDVATPFAPASEAGLFSPSAPHPSPADATQPATRLVSTGAAVRQVTTVPSPVVPDLTTGAAAPTLVQALGTPVRVGNLSPMALWMPVAGCVVAVALIFGLLTGLVGALSARSSTPTPQADSAAPASDPRPAAEPKPAGAEAPKPAGEVVRAPPVDEKMLRELSQRAPKDRTLDEALAIHRGQAELKQSELARLGRESMQPGFANDSSNVKKLLGYVHSPDTARQALEIFARLPSIVGPDVLYQVWTASGKRSSTTELAEALALSKEVRARASPALAAALDLRSAESCEQVKQVLPRVAEHGDRRSVAWLGKLASKTGCGANKRADCYPCLRDGDDLKSAQKAAGKRRAPRH